MAGPRKDAPTSRLERAAPWLLGGLALLVFSPALFNELTNWDDTTYVKDSPFVRAGWAGVGLAFTTFYDGAYLPVTHAVLTVLTALFGERALPLHATHLLCFALVVALLPGALAVVGVPRRVALLATALWALHPFKVESVVWVASLKDTLSALGLVAAVRVYGTGRFGSSALAFMLGLLAKPTIAPAALLFTFLEWRRGGRGGFLRSLAWLGPAVALGLVALVAHTSNPSLLRPASTAWTAAATPLWYLSRLFWPEAPRAVYAWPPLGPTSGWVLGGLAAVLGLLGVCAVFRRTAWGRWGLGLSAWYLLLLAPVGGLLPLAYPVAERYTFWPSLSVALAVGFLLAAAPWRWALALTTAAAAALVAVSVPRVLDWKSSLTLWESNLAADKTLFTVRYNYAGALGGVGRFDEAYLQLQTARAMVPQWPGIDCQLALARAAKEKVDPSWVLETLPALCRAKPDEKWAAAKQLLRQKDPRARLVLEELDMGEHRAASAAASAALALQQGDFPQAEVLAQLARQWDPSLEGATVTLALSLVQQRRFADALPLLDAAFRDPRVAAQLMGVRAVILNAQGKTEEAQRLLDESVARLRALGETVPVQ